MISTISKTSLYISMAIFMSISLLTTENYSWEAILKLTPILQDIKAIAFMSMAGLSLFRGTYFLKMNGFKKEYIFEIILGLVFVLGSITLAYVVKTKLQELTSVFSLDMNKTNHIEWQRMVAENRYIIKGEIVEFHNEVYIPTVESNEARLSMLESQGTIKRVSESITNIISVAIISIILGFVLNYRPLTNTRREI